MAWNFYYFNIQYSTLFGLYYIFFHCKFLSICICYKTVSGEFNSS